MECCAALFEVETWPLPVPDGWVEVRCLCGYVSEPMDPDEAEAHRQRHEAA